MSILNKHKKNLLPALYVLVSLHAQAELISFENVNVISMNDSQVLVNHRIIVDDEKIAAIEPMATKNSIKVGRTIDCHGKYMMPGFVETHYHPRGGVNENYKLLIANGITGVVSMGEDAGQDAIAIKEYANQKSVLAPVYFTAGPMIGENELKTSKDAIELVQYHKKRGYDFIKVHADFPQDAYLTLLEEAEKARIPVIGHAQHSLPLEYSLRLTNIAHMEEFVYIFSDNKNFNVTEFSEPQAKQIAMQVKNSGIYVSPTLTIVALIQDHTDDQRFEKLKSRTENRYLSKDVFREATEPGEYRSDWFLSTKGKKEIDRVIKDTQLLTQAFYAAGVPMLVGSDNFGLQIAGFSFHDEMAAMNKAGMSAFDVLNSATVLSARYLKRQAVAGTISVGKKAELVLLANNPLVDIKNTRDVQGVMLKGKWLDKKALNQLLLDVENTRKLEK